MKIGTKSLLFGAHQFVLHPLFTAAGWIGRYGFSAKGYKWWKLLICFVIHDWGYWGCDNMDGKEGELHPIVAAGFIRKYFNTRDWDKYVLLCAYHSRFLAKRHNATPSLLCWADKLGNTYMPIWLWVSLAKISKEAYEYTGTLDYRELVKRHKVYRKHIKKQLKEVL